MMRYFTAACLLLCLCAGNLTARGDTKNAFIFSKNGKEKGYYFEDYSRLTFSSDHFVLTPSRSNPDQNPVTISYDDFRKIILGEYVSDDINMLPETNDLFFYDKAINQLVVKCENPENFQIGVFSLDGVLVASGHGAVNLQGINPDIYIGIATDGTTKLFKFRKLVFFQEMT